MEFVDLAVELQSGFGFAVAHQFLHDVNGQVVSPILSTGFPDCVDRKLRNGFDSRTPDVALEVS